MQHDPTYGLPRSADPRPYPRLCSPTLYPHGGTATCCQSGASRRGQPRRRSRRALYPCSRVTAASGVGAGVKWGLTPHPRLTFCIGALPLPRGTRGADFCLAAACSFCCTNLCVNRGGLVRRWGTLKRGRDLRRADSQLGCPSSSQRVSLPYAETVGDG